MHSVYFYAFIGIIVIFLVLGILVIIPTERNPVKSKKKREKENKDWKAVSERLEKHIYKLRNKIVVLERKEQSLEREVSISKSKYKKIQEKLTQERSWKGKEQTDIEKKTKEVIRLKKDLSTAEKSLAEEYAKRLRLEREIKETEANIAEAKDQNKALDADIIGLKTQVDKYRQDIKELREINNKISKKKDESSFVAKSDYTKLETKMKAVEKELKRYKRIVDKEIKW